VTHNISISRIKIYLVTFVFSANGDTLEVWHEVVFVDIETVILVIFYGIRTSSTAHGEVTSFFFQVLEGPRTK
jgi:hypothetical protein